MSFLSRFFGRIRGAAGVNAIPSAVPNRLVVVGIDFGTSGTKAVFRDVLAKETVNRVVDFGTSAAGFCRFSRPSSIAANLNGKGFHFGEEAEKTSRAQCRVIRAPKMELLRRGCAENAASQPSETVPPVSELHEWPEFLVALYLRDVLEHVLPLVVTEFPGIQDGDLLFNIDAPIADFSGDRSEPIFRRALGAALSMLEERASVSNAQAAWDSWRVARAEFEEQLENDRRAFVVPESQAIIMGSAQLGDIRDDLYKAVIDIGAGTTDVAFFKLVEPKGKQPTLYFFSAGTRAYGCNDIDMAFAQTITDQVQADAVVDRFLLQGIRENKKALVRGEEQIIKRNGLEFHLDPEVYSASCSLGSREVFDHYRRMCGQAYSLDRSPDRWHHLRLVSAGGGSLLPPIQQHLAMHPKDFGSGTITSVSMIEMKPSHAISVCGASSAQPSEEELPFLLTVLGLATPKPQMPVPVNPDQIDPLPLHRGATGLYGWEAPDDVG